MIHCLYGVAVVDEVPAVFANVFVKVSVPPQGHDGISERLGSIRYQYIFAHLETEAFCSDRGCDNGQPMRQCLANFPLYSPSIAEGCDGYIT